MSKYGPNAALYVDWAESAKSGPPYAIYFFRKTQYIRWDVDNEKLFDGYPADISAGWPGLLEVFPGHDLSGAIHVPDWHNKIYFFFRGQDKFVTWDVAEHCLDPEPRAISEVMPSDLTRDGQFSPLYVDTGKEKKVYAFRADTYTRWTVLPDRAIPQAEDDGYPRKIGDGWTGGMTIAPNCAVSVNWPQRNPQLTNRKVYFFLDDLYTRWDVDSHSKNYRLDIPSGWGGWPDFA